VVRGPVDGRDRKACVEAKQVQSLGIHPMEKI
jgi:hypothetical protein